VAARQDSYPIRRGEGSYTKLAGASLHTDEVLRDSCGGARPSFGEKTLQKHTVTREPGAPFDFGSPVAFVRLKFPAIMSAGSIKVDIQPRSTACKDLIKAFNERGLLHVFPLPSSIALKDRQIPHQTMPRHTDHTAAPSDTIDTSSWPATAFLSVRSVAKAHSIAVLDTLCSNDDSLRPGASELLQELQKLECMSPNAETRQRSADILDQLSSMSTEGRDPFDSYFESEVRLLRDVFDPSRIFTQEL